MEEYIEDRLQQFEDIVWVLEERENDIDGGDIISWYDLTDDDAGYSDDAEEL